MEPNPVIFQTERFDLSWPDRKSEPLRGEDCARFFAEQLPRYGVRVVDPEPDFHFPSLIPRFLRKKPTDEDYEVVRRAIASIIDTELVATNVRWLTYEEFDQLA